MGLCFKNRFFGKIIIISVAVILANLCGGNLRAEKVNSIVAIVNDQIITNFDVLRRTAIAIQEAEGKYDSAELEQKKVLFYDEALNELINREVLVQTAQTAILADELDMEEIEKDLDAFIKGAANEVGSLSKFYEIVSEQGIDPLEKKRELRDDIMVEKILRKNVYSKVKVRPKDKKDYYKAHLDEYYKEGQVSFRQILLNFSEFNSKSEARVFADDLLRKLVSNRDADFADMAKKYSHGAHASNGGLWEGEEVKDFMKDIREIAYKLREKQITGIIESSIGFHILKCEENKGGSYAELKDVQDDIRQKIFREKFGKLKKEYIEELKKKFFIQRM